jgi:hypothetical protein
MWLGAVGIDTTRTSDIEFQPFEHSWVLAPQERQRLASVKSVAVIPFVGDTVMAERWAVVLDKMTDLRVVSPSGGAWHGNRNVQTDLSKRPIDYAQTEWAQRISRESDVDCVLFGTVAGQEPQQSFAGLKESSSQRLYLNLVSAEGTLLWKSELPFMVVTGAKVLNEAAVTLALLTHVEAQADELGLAELGLTSRRTSS